MSDIKFSGDEDELLIELVSNNPPLFNAQLESYKDGNIRDNIWRDIAEKLKKNDKDCKTRWKYIRDSYNRFKRKRKTTTGSAAPSKHSKWEFFERLQFLELVPNERNTTSNIESDISSPSIITEEEQPQENIDGCDEEQSKATGKPPSLAKANKRRKKGQDDFLEYLKKRDESRQMILQELSITPQPAELDDDISSFANNVKSVLRKLNPRMKVQAKSEIFSILTKYEMLQMEQEERLSYSTENSYEQSELHTNTEVAGNYYNNFCNL